VGLGGQGLLHSHAGNRTVNLRLPHDVAKCFSGSGGQTVLFTLMQETETVNLRFPRNVADCLLWEGRVTESLYSHAGNRNCKYALPSWCSWLPSVGGKGDKSLFIFTQETENCKHALPSWCCRLPSVGRKGGTVFFTLMLETQRVNMCFPRDVAECLQRGRGTVYFPLMQETETVQMRFLREVAEGLPLEGKGTQSSLPSCRKQKL
jgi:hypothetical protein